MTTTSLADAKARLSEIVASAAATHERTIITKQGRPVAALLSIEDLESLEETLDILSDPQLVADIVTARASLDRGEGVEMTYEEGLAAIRRRAQPA
ncbi:type II toxin-antitoxin system Phd/YefM family antitoxin [Angustibacter aerolatus]